MEARSLFSVWRVSIALAVPIMAAAPLRGAALTTTSQRADPASLTTFVDSLFRVHMVSDEIPGAVFTLVRNGRVTLARAYGIADLDRGTPVRLDRTLFRIGSVTKVFTALALVQLADRGHIDLDEPVRPYLDGLLHPPRFAPVRFRHLLIHTGGFDQTGLGRHAASRAQRPSLGAFLDARLVQVRPPGVVGVYDTYGITLAGYLVERISDLTYAEHMRRNVFEPLGMRRTFVETPETLRTDLAVGYGLEDGRHVPQEYEYYVTLPASSIDATAADMGRLLVALLGDGSTDTGRLLSPEFSRRVQREPGLRYAPEMGAFAFGFWVEHRNGQRALHHGGVMRGYSSQLYLVPSDRLGFFFAYNRDPETGPPPRLREAVTTALLDRLFPDSGPKPRPPERPLPIDTRRFAGAYANTVGCFTCEEGEGWGLNSFRLTAPEPGVLQGAFRWLAIDSLLFRRADGSGRIAFLTDETGAVRYLVQGPNSFAKLDDGLLDEILGPGWENRPASSLEATVHRANERWSEAARAYATLADRTPDRGRLHFYAGFCWLNAGEPGRAIPPLQRATELEQWTAWSQYYIAAAHAAQRDTNAALDALERALDLGFSDGNLLQNDPWWDPLREDRRFLDLAHRLEDER